MKSLVKLSFLVLAIVCAFSIVDAAWSTKDSYPSLYAAFSAYCDPDYLQNWSCGWCTTNLPGTLYVGSLTDWLTSTFGYVAIQGNDIVVAYRGSQCFMNWVNNLNFWWTEYPPVPKAYVHRGFFDAYKTVQSQTRQNVALARQRCPTCNIRITGHSLGGALATHAAADLSFVYPVSNSSSPRISLITFGSPRVGDLTFSSWLSKQISTSWRMTHNADPVPHLPPTANEIDWHHVPTEIFERNTNDYKQCNGSGEDFSCSDGILFPVNTADHLIYMGVKSSAKSLPNCQKNGPNCSVFTAEEMQAILERKLAGKE